LNHLPKAFIIRHVHPFDAAKTTLSILGSLISNGKRIIISKVNTDSLLGRLDITEYLIKERVFGSLVKSHRNSTITKAIEIGTDGYSIDKIG